MNLLTKAIVLVLLAAGGLAARAQEHLYAAVDYMHIPEGQSAEQYIGLEKLWQRLHQKAVDAGLCRAWYLDRVENGGRSDFVTVRLYDSLDKMVNAWPDSLRAGLYTSDETAEMRRTGQFRSLIHSELWELESSAMKNDGESQLPVYVDFMKPKPGKAGAYYSMEHDFYQKIHKVRIEAGQMKSWFFLSRMYPHGTDGEYDFITVNIYSDKGPAWDGKLAQSALTKEEWDKMPHPSEVRTLVREEIWHPVLRTTPAKKQ
jgi:hypothetical protein